VLTAVEEISPNWITRVSDPFFVSLHTSLQVIIIYYWKIKGQLKFICPSYHSLCNLS